MLKTLLILFCSFFAVAPFSVASEETFFQAQKSGFDRAQETTFDAAYGLHYGICYDRSRQNFSHQSILIVLDGVNGPNIIEGWWDGFRPSDIREAVNSDNARERIISLIIHKMESLKALYANPSQSPLTVRYGENQTSIRKTGSVLFLQHQFLGNRKVRLAVRDNPEPMILESQQVWFVCSYDFHLL